jgi:hypothetical protein
MPYIGKTPTVGNFQVCDAISVVNGQAAYTLQVGGVNVAPESANHMLVSLNGILQKPGSSFTISGSTMTFASNLATGDVIDFVQILGNVLDIGQPSDDTVTAAKLNNDIISGQTALTSSPDDTDELLISDAGTIKRIDVSLVGGKNTPFTTVKKSSDQTINHGTDTKITFDSVINESSSSLFDLTNNKFTVVTAGTYLILPQLRLYDSDNALKRAQCNIYKNGSPIKSFMYYDHDDSSNQTREVALGSGFLETLSVDDYIEMYCYFQTDDSGTLVAESDYQGTSLGIMRIIT